MNTWIGADKFRTRWLLTACWPYTSSSLHASTRKSIILIKPLIYIFPAAFELALLEFWLTLSNYILVYGWCTITCWREPNTHNHQSLIPYISRSDLICTSIRTLPTHIYLIIQRRSRIMNGYRWLTMGHSNLDDTKQNCGLHSSGHIMRSMEKILIKKQKSNLK